MIPDKFDVGRVRADLAATRLRVALLRCSLAWKYNPEQPRVPAGNPDGGRWAGGLGASSGATSSNHSRYVQVAEGITALQGTASTRQSIAACRLQPFLMLSRTLCELSRAPTGPLNLGAQVRQWFSIPQV